MAELTGNWALVSSENFEAYISAIVEEKEEEEEEKKKKKKKKRIKRRKEGKEENVKEEEEEKEVEEEQTPKLTPKGSHPMGLSNYEVLMAGPLPNCLIFLSTSLLILK